MLSDYTLNPSNYIIEKEIGHGNFGVVYLVHELKNETVQLAMKKIENEDEFDYFAQKLLIREISVMASLDHPNLLKLVGFSLPTKEKNEFNIFSEYIPNNTLQDELKKSIFDNNDDINLDATKLSIIVYGIASAMMHLHKKNIVHRDLKPENIFLDKNYYPILSDFGLSRFIEDDIQMTSKLGTPYYMAPELFSDEETLTNKIDVYAFAITLLFIFARKFEFVKNAPKSIDRFAKYIKNGNRFKIPKNVPEFYVSLINRCWAHAANDRPSFEEIVKEFENNDSFILEGADIDVVHQYIRENKKYNVESSESDDECIDETKEFDFSQ